MAKGSKTSGEDLVPMITRLKTWHREKAKSRMKELGLGSIAEYIRHLIEKDK